MASNLNPNNLDLLINRALAIEDELALDADALGFMARAMVQATLPHSKVAGNEFTRKNGNYSLTILSPSTIGLPYGSIPRLLLAWVTTEAVQTKSKELELGDSLSGFMRELDLVPTGGRWGSITRLKEQTKRLFASSITAIYEQGQGTQIINQSVADRAVFWWHPKDPNQTALWKSSISLTETFYREIVDRPVPIDMRAIKALKKSPMALDIYTWLTYRVSYLKKPTAIPWASLAMQFGSNYSRLTDFRMSFLSELKKVVTVYGGVQVEVSVSGLMLKPSLTHIGMKGKTK
jgi:Plasmid encoded RepA protein